MATDAPQQSNSSTQAADTAPLAAGDPRPGSLRAWLACIRPKTLGVAAAPVAVGLGVAAAAGHEFHFLVAVTTLALSLLMQIITNMENDAGYTKKKAGGLRLPPLSAPSSSAFFSSCSTRSTSSPWAAGSWWP